MTVHIYQGAQEKNTKNKKKKVRTKCSGSANTGVGQVGENSRFMRKASGRFRMREEGRFARISSAAMNRGKGPDERSGGCLGEQRE